ncbi:MAG TPA: outer membrane lipoprotein-sorting protein [Terracidiphilus sp.]|nr:outer membrane lipoprotein-sorting protein [Terracidiphilus sp.]
MARKLVFAAPLLFLLALPAPPSFAAGQSPTGKSATSDKLQQVLQQLDGSAAKFRSASADFEEKDIQTVPVPNTDTRTGTIYFEHRGGEVRMAAHVKQFNGQPNGSVYTYTHGVFQLFDPQQNQVTKVQNSGNLAGYLSLGFGATGKDLQDKFEITYLGQETVDGVKTDKLQLIPKDQKARNLFSKVTIWIDPARNVNLKQVFDEGQGLSRVCTYSNIQMNHSISSSEFSFKTNKKTQFTTQ